MKKHEAIYKLNPTVVTIRGDEAFDAEGNTPLPADEVTNG